jgi:hypothetical protein
VAELPPQAPNVTLANAGQKSLKEELKRLRPEFKQLNAILKNSYVTHNQTKEAMVGLLDKYRLSGYPLLLSGHKQRLAQTALEARESQAKRARRFAQEEEEEEGFGTCFVYVCLCVCMCVCDV